MTVFWSNFYLITKIVFLSRTKVYRFIFYISSPEVKKYFKMVVCVIRNFLFTVNLIVHALVKTVLSVAVEVLG